MAASWKWSQAAPVPINTQELYAAAHKSKLYVGGGIAAKAAVPYFTAACFSYDPTNDVWSEQPDLPEKTHHAAFVSNDKDLFQIGGFNGGFTHVWRMRNKAYRLDGSEWVPAVDLPKPQAEGVLSTGPDGAIHLATGQSPKGEANRKRSDHTEVHDHWRWDPATSAWEKAAPIPTARNSATGGWVNKQFIVTGGRTSGGNLAATEIYDPQEDRWRSGAPMPLPQAGTASAVVGDELIVFGGEIFIPEADVFPNVWSYNPGEDKWTPLPDLPTPRHGLGAGVIGNKIYVIGGATEPGGSGTTDLNEVLTVP